MNNHKTIIVYYSYIDVDKSLKNGMMGLNVKYNWNVTKGNIIKIINTVTSFQQIPEISIQSIADDSTNNYYDITKIKRIEAMIKMERTNGCE